MPDSEELPDPVVEIDDNIGRNLKSMREARGISQAELARVVTDAGLRGFHQTTIARIEKGQRSLRASEAIAIARVLDTSLEWLADSGANAQLRSHSRWIGEQAKAFDEAASGLIHARLLAAQHLDRILPYGPDGIASREDILRSGVDPQLYDILENRIVSASPEERLANLYFNESRHDLAYGRRGGAAHKQRVEFIMDEYRGEEEEAGPKDAPGEFEGATKVTLGGPDGEHPAEA